LYATANLYDRYRNDAVNTASPMDLIIMLYDGCIKQIHLARLYEEDKNVAERSNAIQKAQDILDELMRSLDMGIPLSADLLKLYDFMSEELYQANMKRDMARMEPVEAMLTELRDAWKEVKVTTGKMYVEEDE
jgi:flagellar protein FliS